MDKMGECNDAELEVELARLIIDFCNVEDTSAQDAA